MQLRDAQTSELIAEGTPLELATAAADMDPSDILFDGAGAVDEATGRSLFDPQAVRQTRADEIASLQAQIAAPPPAGEDPAATAVRREQLRAVLQERRDRIRDGKAKVADARQVMADARQRVKKRARGG